LVARIAILPAGAAAWYSSASSSRSFIRSPQRVAARLRQALPLFDIVRVHALRIAV
jgi:hypothetical protein